MGTKTINIIIVSSFKDFVFGLIEIVNKDLKTRQLAKFMILSSTAPIPFSKKWLFQGDKCHVLWLVGEDQNSRTAIFPAKNPAHIT